MQTRVEMTIRLPIWETGPKVKMCMHLITISTRAFGSVGPLLSFSLVPPEIHSKLATKAPHEEHIRNILDWIWCRVVL
jgi:hypothetical protein